MKKIINPVIAAASAAALSVGIASAQHESDRDAIISVLSQYEAALNASDTDAVMSLYTEDGVFMPQHSQSSVGAEAVHAAYDAVFRAITLNVEFDIQEVMQLAPQWAFARTNSAGTVTINATGGTNPEANQELFVFQKVGDDWKIARYSFSTTNPPRQ